MRLLSRSHCSRSDISPKGRARLANSSSITCGARAMRVLWTLKEDALLRRHWRDGLTALEISQQMGRTRRAVIGRAHRLNLNGRTPRAKIRQLPSVAPTSWNRETNNG